MIVDDSNMIRSRIARIVGDGSLPGWAIIGMARSGIEAIRLAETLEPDVVTMDLTMPGMDGVECIPRLLRNCPDCAILVVSALNDRTTVFQSIHMGARGFLHKPFTDSELKNALLELVTV